MISCPYFQNTPGIQSSLNASPANTLAQAIISHLDYCSYLLLGLLHFPSSTTSTVYSHCSKQTHPFKIHVCHYITPRLRTCLTCPPSLSTAHPCRGAAGITYWSPLLSWSQPPRLPLLLPLHSFSPPHSFTSLLPPQNMDACCSLSMERISSGLHLNVTFTEMSALKLYSKLCLFSLPQAIFLRSAYSLLFCIFFCCRVGLVCFSFFTTTSLPWLKHKNSMRAGHCPAARTVPACSMCSAMSEWR